MKAVLCALLLAGLSLMVSAQYDFCVSGDNEIRELYIDGKDFSSKLRQKKNLRKCDCFKLPKDAGLIAMKVKNWKGYGSVQTCNTGNPTLLEGWVCEPIRDHKKAHWKTATYNDKNWDPPKRAPCKSFQRCKGAKAKTLPCNPAKYKGCFWSEKPAKEIYCRLKQCASACTGCKSGGVGKCDSDKCKFGPVVAGKPTCNHKCCLVVKTGPDPAVERYMQLTDEFSGRVDRFSIQQPNGGGFYAIVDMDTCTFSLKESRSADKKGEITTLAVKYASASLSPELKNMIGIEADHDTWIGIWNLGIGETQASPYDAFKEVRLCLTGVNNNPDKLQRTDVQTSL
jgi:hypothetical protein